MITTVILFLHYVFCFFLEQPKNKFMDMISILPRVILDYCSQCLMKQLK